MTPCSVKRCNRRQYVAELCKTHAKVKADRLFSEHIRRRDGGCVAEGEHAGALQCAHIFSRRYSAIRWDTRNAVALCAGHHTFWTLRPLEWEQWAHERLGMDYVRLRKLALEGERPDLGHVIAYLEAA